MNAMRRGYRDKWLSAYKAWRQYRVIVTHRKTPHDGVFKVFQSPQLFAALDICSVRYQRLKSLLAVIDACSESICSVRCMQRLKSGLVKQ